MKLLKALTDVDSSPTLIYRFWNISTGIVVLIFASFWFTPQEQGFYFSFLSLAALQVFFELGLNYVATQFVAHEAAALEKNSCNSYLHPNRVRISHLILFLNKWYSFAAPIFFFTATLVGYFVFSQKSDIDKYNWMPPWTLLVLFTSINLYYSPVFAVAEGMGEVGAVAKFRLKQSIIGHILMWTGFFLGWGLWAAWIAQGTATVFTFIFAMKDRRIAQHFRYNASMAKESVFNWKKELLPMQWRIALSWMSGYLLFPSLTPIVLLNCGSIDAGQFGLAISGFNAVIALGMSFVYSKGPAIATMIAKKNLVQAKKIYIDNTVVTVALVALGSISIIVFALVSDMSIFHGYVRLPEFPIILSLSVNSLANSLVFSAAVFMRAHKVEPMATVSAVSSLLCVAVFYLGSLSSITLAVISYTAVTTLVTLPWTLIILRRFTKASYE